MRIILSIPLTLNEVATSALSERVPHNSVIIKAISTNSKEVCPGDLFVALTGDKSSGENYIQDAKKRGAYVLSSRDKNADIKVRDTTLALLRIASYYKLKLTDLKKTVAITGSVGKTTTKNVLAKMLSNNYKTHATEANYNNFIGMSYTLLSAPADTEIIVAEIGMNHLGEISLLSRMLRPDIAIITNIGTSHIGNLGSRELIAKAKLEITDGMSSINLIVPYEENLLKNTDGVHTVSIENPYADCYLKIIEENSSHTSFNIHSSNTNLKNLKIFIPGRQILNALILSVKAMELIGINKADIEKSIKHIDTNCVRGKIIKIDDFFAYDDTYSSSAEAVLADFELLSLYKDRPKSCMLGDMLELGDETDNLHKKIGRAVFEYGFRNLYTIGHFAPLIAAAAIDAGMKQENIFINIDSNAIDITAKQILINHVENELILFKASHNIHAERIIQLLLKYTNKGSERN